MNLSMIDWKSYPDRFLDTIDRNITIKVDGHPVSAKVDARAKATVLSETS